MKVSESTEFTLDIKTLVLIISFVVTAAGMWFALQGDIEEAKRLPEPVVTRTEYDLKDKLIRETIMNTQEKVQENGEKLDLIEERLYEITVLAQKENEMEDSNNCPIALIFGSCPGCDGGSDQR
jgi:hypothetical protein